MRKRDRNPLALTSRGQVAAGLIVACAAATAASPYLSFVAVPNGVAWPAAGFALVALLTFGYDVWPAVAGGMFIGAISAGVESPVAALIAAAATIEAVAGARLANRIASGTDSMTSARSFVRFCVATGVIAAAVGPALGFPALALLGRAPTDSAAAAALSWWLGDGVSTIAIAPALLLWSRGTINAATERRVIEATGLAAALALPWLALFSGWVPSVAQAPLEVICVPAMLWAAYRFGPRIASLCVAGLAAVALSGTRSGAGPFALSTPFTSYVTLQAFIGITAVTTLALAVVTSERRAAELRLADLARTDALTGLVNFRALTEALDAEVARAMRRGQEFALLALDVDRLKEINDTFGHLIGNVAIRRLATAMRLNCRTIDVAARIGGDEFCLLLPDTDEANARQVMVRIRNSLAAYRDGPRVTASCGLAMYPRDGATGEQLLGAADVLLYGAKAERAATPRAKKSVRSRAAASA